MAITANMSLVLHDEGVQKINAEQNIFCEHFSLYTSAAHNDNFMISLAKRC